MGKVGKVAREISMGKTHKQWLDVSTLFVVIVTKQNSNYSIFFIYLFIFILAYQ